MKIKSISRGDAAHLRLVDKVSAIRFSHDKIPQLFLANCFNAAQSVPAFQISSVLFGCSITFLVNLYRLTLNARDLNANLPGCRALII